MTKKNGSIYELIESMSKFSWAMSLFGVNQLVNIFVPDFWQKNGNGEVDASNTFNRVVLSIQENLDEPLKTTFLVGDRFQSAMTDLFYNFLDLNSFNSRNALKSGFEILLRSSDIARVLMPGNVNPVFLQEFRNKLQAFSLFEYVDEFLPPVSERSLKKMIESAGLLEPYDSIWAMEGIGHYYTEKVLAVMNFPNHLLSSEVASNLPENSLIPLHAGMGLSLSRNLLQRIETETTFRTIVELIRSHTTLCRINSRSGYMEIVFETLGLVTRNLYPHLLLPIDEALGQLDEDYTAYFWHGVGRAMYFSPTGLFPVCDEGWASILATQDEPPHKSGCLDALTGWMFALTLVNIRQPEVIAACFKRHQRLFTFQEIVEDGIGSAMIVWQISTQDIVCIESFLNYIPVGEDSDFVSAWRSFVSEPIASVLHDYHAKSENERQPHLLFRNRRRETRRNALKYEAPI